MAKKNEQNEIIKLYDPQKDLKIAEVKITGDTPLMLSKYTRGTISALTDKQTGKADKGRKNVDKFYEVIERIHWLDPLPPENEMIYDEQELNRLLTENKPCVLGTAIWKSVLSTVVRCGFDTYSTKLKATFRVLDDKVPIEFGKMVIDERIVPSKTGQKPILTYRPVFHDWSAKFRICFTEDVYSSEQIFAFLNQSGFSGGIGTCRPGTSGFYGMFHVSE